MKDLSKFKKGSLLTFWGIIIVLIIVNVLLFINLGNDKYKTIHCEVESDDFEQDMYFNFDDGKIYKATSVKYMDYLEDKYTITRDEFLNKQSKFKGLSGNVWHDEDEIIMTEIYLFKLLNNQELEETLGISKELFVGKSREEIIKTVKQKMNVNGNKVVCE